MEIDKGKTKKILHTADWHMDDNNHDEVKRILDVIVEKALLIKPDLIIVAGDLTNSQNTKLDSRSARSLVDIMNQLSCIAPVIIVIGTPSHDGLCTEILNRIPYSGKIGRLVHVSARPEFLHIVGGEILTPEQVADMDNSATDFLVSTLPTPTKQFFPEENLSITTTDKQIAKAINGIFGGFAAMATDYPNAPHIHVGHYHVAGAYVSDTQVLIGVDIEIHPDQFLLLNADVVALGHIHKAQEMKNNVFYPGSTTHNTFGELDPKGFYLHSFRGEKMLPAFKKESEFIDLPARDLYIIRKNFLEREVDEDEIRNDLKGIDLVDSWLKIEIKIWHDEVRQINQAALKNYFIELGCDKVVVDLIPKPRVAVRSEKILDAETLPEKIIEMGIIKNEEIPASLLEKASLLESMNPEELIASIGGN